MQYFQTTDQTSKSPDVTKSPKLIPNKYSANKSNTKGGPNSKIDTPNNGIEIKTAGTKPIKVLKIAVKVNETIISLILIGAMNRLVKFLLQIPLRTSC